MMWSNVLRVALALALGTALTACKAGKTLQNTAKRSAELKVEPLAYTYYSAKGRIAFEDLAQEIKSSADIRIRKDSVIWMSLRSGTGIEGVRALITPDSIFVVNRLEKQYHRYSFEQLSKKFNFQFDFDLLQSLLVGDIPLDARTKGRVEKERDHFVVEGNLANPRANLTLFVNRYLDKVDKLILVDRRNQNDLQVVYENFQVVEQQQVPHSAQAKLHYTDKNGALISTLSVTHSRIQLSSEPLKFPFEIPSKYTQASFFE